MTFGHPLALVALLLVPAALAFAVLVRRRPSRHAVGYTNLDVLASVLEPRRNWKPWVAVAFLMVALTFAASALARPHVMLPSRVDKATVVLLVDVSGSMRAEDVEPTRLDAATASMRTFLDRLPERYRVGLVQFSTETDVLIRPTHDRQVVRQALAYLEPDAGTAIGDGLATATKVLKQALAQERAQTAEQKAGPGAIVLLSDGTQTNGRLPVEDGVNLARRNKFPVYTVALGTVGPRAVVPGPGNVMLSVPPDPRLMRDVATATRGQTFAASNAEEMDAVFERLSSSIGRERQSRDVSSWFLLAAGVALIGALALGRLLAGALSS